MYHVLTLLRFGRFDEILEVTKRPEREVNAGLWDFAQGYAKLRAGERRLRAPVPVAGEEDRSHLEADVPRPPGQDAARRRRPASSKARSCAPSATRRARWRRSKRAVKADDEIEYDEPEPLHFDARHWLGAMQLDAGMAAEAEATYRTELEGASAQRLVAARPAAGAEGAGQADGRGRRRSSRRRGRGRTPGSAPRGSEAGRYLNSSTRTSLRKR